MNDTAKQLTPIDAFTSDLARHEKQFDSVLPVHVPVKKFMRIVVGAVQNNPKILECDRSSLYRACQKAAQDGLIIDGREAALVPFKGMATYMPMVAGVLKKMRNSGEISSVNAHTVHENDIFDYDPSRPEDLRHASENWFGNRGDLIGVYAFARLKDGGTVCELMGMEDIKKIRSASRSGDNGPWADWFEEMAKKSVLRRIAKRLPSSADTDQMFMHDNDNFDLDKSPDPITPAAKTGTRAASIIEGSIAAPDEMEGDVI